MAVERGHLIRRNVDDVWKTIDAQNRVRLEEIFPGWAAYFCIGGVVLKHSLTRDDMTITFKHDWFGDIILLHRCGNPTNPEQEANNYQIEKGEVESISSGWDGVSFATLHGKEYLISPLGLGFPMLEQNTSDLH